MYKAMEDIEKTSIKLYLSMYKAMDCWENQYKVIHVHRQYKIIPVYVQGYGLE